MTPEIEAFKKQLNNNPITNTYLTQIFPRLDQKSTLELNQAIQLSSNRYIPYLDFLAEADTPADPNVLLKSIFEKNSLFAFSISHLLNRDPKHQDLARRFLIAVILSVLYSTEDPETASRFFLDTLDKDADLQTLNDQVFQPGEGTPALLKRLYLDLIAFAKNQFVFKSTKNLLELIEIQFCFQGIDSIFLRFYFQLLSLTSQDTVSTHLDAVFSRIFTLIRLEEIKYWKTYPNYQVLQSKIYHIIQMNAHSKRHPQLRKEIFNKLSEYLPIIHDGSKRRVTAGTNDLLRKQLTLFQEMSIVRIKLLISMVQKLKGDGYTIYLLTHLFKSKQDKYSELQGYLKQSAEKSDQYLAQLAESLAERFAAVQSARQSDEQPSKGKRAVHSNSGRTAETRKNLAQKSPQGKVLTQHDITEFLKNWLEKLLQRAKIEGALTYDQLPKYLAQFAEAAEPVMTQISQSRQEELVEAFNSSTDEILDNFTAKGNITQEQAEQFKAQIHKKTDTLKSLPANEADEEVEEVENSNSASQEPPTEARPASETAPAVEEPLPVKESQTETPSQPANTPPADEEPQNFDQILQSEKITIGFGDKSPKMTLSDFFTLPLGERSGPNEDDWFGFHKKYIRVAVDKGVVKTEVLEVLDEMANQLPKLIYIKYFNIFPTDELEETTLFAVHDIWASGALQNMRA